jgi:hypothetical protein
VRALLFLLVPALLPAQIPRVGVVDYYGLRKVSEDKVRKAAGIQEGDRLPASKGDVEERIEKIPGVVLARLEAVCCTDDRVILYIGIEERDAPHFDFHDPPRENISLPEDVVDAYHGFLRSFEKAARAGETAEDLTHGHALSSDPAARAYQEKFVSLADSNAKILHEVVREAMDPEQRAIAAYIIGYQSKDKQVVVNDLQNALQDDDDSVRANATRSLTALAVFADRNPESGIRIQPTWFVEMLNSIVWSDRYRAATALVNLTEHRDASTLEELHDRALTSLIEMARWRTLAHALPAFILVGRIAGLAEKEIEDAWSRGDRESVIKRALATPRIVR